MEKFKSSPFKAPPVVHISFITTLQADVDHGPGKIQGWSFIYQDGKVTTAYFWKLTTNFFI